MWRKAFAFLDRAIGALSLCGAFLAACALGLIAVSVIIEVVARSVFHRPTIWAVEISTYAIIAAGFLGAAFVLRRGRHLEIHLLTSRLPDPARRALGVVTDLAGAVFCVLVVVYGARFVNLTYIMGAVSVSELRVPLWIPQIVLPVGFGLLGLEFVGRVMARLGLVDRPADADPTLAHH